jgi:hypothetical protein
MKVIHHYENPQCEMSDVEVKTTAIIVMLYFPAITCRLAVYYPPGLFAQDVEQKSFLSPNETHQAFVPDAVFNIHPFLFASAPTAPEYG